MIRAAQRLVALERRYKGKALAQCASPGQIERARREWQ
jgi:hypothetical protein